MSTHATPTDALPHGDYFEFPYGDRMITAPPLDSPNFPTRILAPGLTHWYAIARQWAIVTRLGETAAINSLAKLRYSMGDLWAVQKAETMIRFGNAGQYQAEPLGWITCKPVWYVNSAERCAADRSLLTPEKDFDAA